MKTYSALLLCLNNSIFLVMMCSKEGRIGSTNKITRMDVANVLYRKGFEHEAGYSEENHVC